jgi:myo-inositol-1(or 4)-monophosphatase
MSGYAQELSFAKRLARTAGTALLKDQAHVEVLGTDDSDNPDQLEHHAIHTRQDNASEEIMRVEIRRAFPQDGMLGEEQGYQHGSSGRVWVFDPKDGSSQYATGNPYDWSVAIGLWQDDRQVLGVVYVPGTDELFFAVLGEGAFLEHDGVREISVSHEQSIRASLVSIGVDMLYLGAFVENGVLRAIAVASACRTTRVVRSSDLELAYAAAGRTSAVYNYRQKAWDCVGMLIFLEAGGRVRRYDDAAPGFVEVDAVITASASDRVSYLACANGYIEQELLALIRRS